MNLGLPRFRISLSAGVLTVFDKTESHPREFEEQEVGGLLLDALEFHSALVERCEAWKELAGLLDELATHYQTANVQPPPRLLNRIRQLRDRLVVNH